MLAEPLEVLRALIKDFEPFDYEQGLCYWCGGGWEQVPGPRGGVGKLTHTGTHKPDCPFAAAEALVRASKA